MTAPEVATELAAAGVERGTPLALVMGRDAVGLAWAGGSLAVTTVEPAELVRALAVLDPRWVWWSARETAAPLVRAGVRPRTCWDLGAVSRLAFGSRREDPAAVWAAAAGLEAPHRISGELSLLDLAGDSSEAVRDDGQLSRQWSSGAWATDAETARAWSVLALTVQARQLVVLSELPDPRAAPGTPGLAIPTAWAESAAALLAVELEIDGLPVDRAVAGDLLTQAAGPRPATPSDEHRLRTERDTAVLQHFPGDPVDLRNPLQVRELLARIGLDVPDTRSWRLEPHASTLPAVAALLRWRKAERLLTTYGWQWLDTHVGGDGRLRGVWGAADAAAGRMTAQAGLHNLPSELRPAVRAEPGWLLVRADLGQIEPRVLAVVSGDEGLAAAARERDMYAPVAAQLRCDRPTAKVAVLAAMYGQTSGTAGAALKDMDRAYPQAMAHLRAAELAGQRRKDLRTYGGRLLRVSQVGPAFGEPVGEHVSVSTGVGRFTRNAVVQGAAAELFKAWAATVRDGLSSLGGQIVLCLHDELLLHVPADRATEVASLLESALESTASWWAAGSKVRFVADIGVGPSWPEAHT